MLYSIYIHIPFCQRRCNYCDFVTYSGENHQIPDYINALIEEFRIVTRLIDKKTVHTIYFGGGTPSLLPIQGYAKILSALTRTFNLTEDCEISLEANPGTLTYEYLKGIRSLGINRISLGAQSFQERDLERLERIHNVEDIYQSYSYARKAGFLNINFDLIFGLPWQKIKEWSEILDQAVVLKPEHFSLYSLIIEPGTQLFDWYQKGMVALLDQDREGDIFEYSMAKLSEAGYLHYEISNWAKKDNKRDYQCRHNVQYWQGEPYLGFGVGAHGYARGVRTANVKSIGEYCKLMTLGSNRTYDFPASPANRTTIKLENLTQMKEHMMMGLRLIDEGVSETKFFALFNRSIFDVFAKEISTLLDLGLLKWSGLTSRNLKLTKRGVMLGNQVFMYFV